MSIATHPAGSGAVSVAVARYADSDEAIERRMKELRGQFVRDDTVGHFRPARAKLLYDLQRFAVSPQQRLLAWLRDNVNPAIPRSWYKLVLGHDLHIASWAELFVQHYHATEPDPWSGNQGWTENIGLASTGKVTAAFKDLETLYLVTDSTAYGDFKFHEVGTSATAEANTDTALVATTGIARATGTQTNPTSATYQSIATVTADSTETWQEHGLFNASTSVTLMDRSVLSPTVPVVSLDTATFTYVLTKAAEA